MADLNRLVIYAIVLPILGGACHSDFRSTVTLPDDCDRRFYFEDQDGDGWGDPDGDYAEQCQADEATKLTARNNLDCDDSDVGVTGQTAAICPAQLVVGGAAYVAFGASGAEFAVVLPTNDYSHIGDASVEVTELIWPDGAASACGAFAWGGDLASIDNQAELSEVTAQIDSIIGDNAYAGWVGLGPNAANDDWTWTGKDEGAGLKVSAVGLCNPSDAPDATDTQDPGRRVALVKPAGGDWCFGFPSDANPEVLGEGEFAYTRREANFICERQPPRAADFEIDRDPAGDGE